MARGEAEIALQQASELRLVPSIRFAGMLPEGVQNWTVYAGALSPAARNKDSALTLMSIFADPSIEPMLKRRGLETPYLPPHSWRSWRATFALRAMPYPRRRVMSSITGAHDPSARDYAGTSPSRLRKGEEV